MNTQRFTIFWLVIFALLINGCTNLSPYESPQVDLIGLEPLPNKNNEL